MFESLKQILFPVVLVGLTMMSRSKDTHDQDHRLADRKLHGIPSLAISPEGRLWARTGLFISSMIIPEQEPERS